MIIELLFAGFFLDETLIKSLSNWTATVFKIGYLPIAPGTWGSVFAVFVWFFLFKNFSSISLFFVAGAVMLLGVYTSNIMINGDEHSDPSEIVIDEVAGQWLSLVGLPHSIGFAAAAFILFRLLDITKPFPIRKLERLQGGWGIMMDDVAAGMITCIFLNVFLFLK